MVLKRRILVLKTGLWILGFTPIGWALYRFFEGDGFGANPIAELQLWGGLSTLTALLITVSVTPVRRLTGWNDLQKARRLIGLFAFFYVCLHFLIYIVLDQTFSWMSIAEDIVKRPYITVGFTAFLLLLPLALTSTRGWIRRLGKRWQKLHRLVYAAGGLGVLHFFWKVKLDTRQPLIFAAILFALLLVRVVRRPGRQPRRSRAADLATAD